MQVYVLQKQLRSLYLKLNSHDTELHIYRNSTTIYRKSFSPTVTTPSHAKNPHHLDYNICQILL